MFGVGVRQVVACASETSQSGFVCDLRDCFRRAKVNVELSAMMIGDEG